MKNQVLKHLPKFRDFPNDGKIKFGYGKFGSNGYDISWLEWTIRVDDIPILFIQIEAVDGEESIRFAQAKWSYSTYRYDLSRFDSLSDIVSAKQSIEIFFSDCFKDMPKKSN